MGAANKESHDELLMSFNSNPMPFSDRSNLAGGLSFDYYAEQSGVGAGAEGVWVGVEGAQIGKRGCDDGGSPAKRMRTDTGHAAHVIHNEEEEQPTNLCDPHLPSATGIPHAFYTHT